MGVDCGTQGTKTIALDADSGRVIAVASQPCEIIPNLPPGHLEQHPASWREAMLESMRRVIESLGERRRDVRGVGVSGQQHGFVPLDRSGNVIRPAKLWCDTSTVTECEVIRTHFGGSRAVIEQVGMDMLPGFTAPKILWMKRNEPENFRRLAHVLLPHDYLNYCLTGRICMEYGDASGTALMDVVKRTWNREMLEFVDEGLPDRMPPLFSSRLPVGPLLPAVSRQLNLPVDVIVSAGGGDNMMGAIGTGNISSGRVTLSLGTSGTIYAYSEKALVDPLGEVAGFCDSTDAWLPLVCTMNVTVATEATRHLFGWSHDQMDEAILSVPPGANGLLFLPYLQGERTPNLPHATGSFHGLTTRNMSPGHFARATMEGVTLGLAYGLNRLRSLGLEPAEIRLTGGGSKSPVWRRLCADIFRCRVVTLMESEGAALGAALQALSIVETSHSINEWSDRMVRVDTAQILEPAANGYDYTEVIEKQASLASRLNETGILA